MAMASVLAEMPDLCERLLVEHQPDVHGRCSACRDEAGTQASWPCLTYQLAQEAKAMSTATREVPSQGRHAR